MALGKIAHAAGEDIEVSVCNSDKGYYLGTVGIYGEIVSRESVEFWGTWRGANEALKSGIWKQKAIF